MQMTELRQVFLEFCNIVTGRNQRLNGVVRVNT